MHSWKKSLRSTTLAALLAFSSTTVALAAPNVTLNVHDGEVRDVLTAISALSDASIVTDESVKGKITIALDNVPFNTAIKLITSAKGLAYRMVDGVILVSTQENLNKFNGSVNVFKLNYAKAVSTLSPILFCSAAAAQMKSVFARQSKRWTLLPNRSLWKPRSFLSTKKTVKTWASTGIGIRYHRTVRTAITAAITMMMKISAA